MGRTGTLRAQALCAPCERYQDFDAVFCKDCAKARPDVVVGFSWDVMGDSGGLGVTSHGGETDGVCPSMGCGMGSRAHHAHVPLPWSEAGGNPLGTGSGMGQWCPAR